MNTLLGYYLQPNDVKSSGEDFGLKAQKPPPKASALPSVCVKTLCAAVMMDSLVVHPEDRSSRLVGLRRQLCTHKLHLCTVAQNFKSMQLLSYTHQNLATQIF